MIDIKSMLPEEILEFTQKELKAPKFRATQIIDWLSKGVKNMNDIAALDADYLKEKEKKKKQPSRPAANKFNNFESRSYDMSDLERRLVQQ